MSEIKDNILNELLNLFPRNGFLKSCVKVIFCSKSKNIISMIEKSKKNIAINIK